MEIDFPFNKMQPGNMKLCFFSIQEGYIKFEIGFCVNLLEAYILNSKQVFISSVDCQFLQKKIFRCVNFAKRSDVAE